MWKPLTPVMCWKIVLSVLFFCRKITQINLDTCRLLFIRDLTCEKFRRKLESCMLKLPKHNDVKPKKSQSTICLKYYNETQAEEREHYNQKKLLF